MPSSSPVVSVIIPAYNAERWVARAIDSALAQTYPAVEVLVINDGSRDGTEAVCRRYGDRIRYHAQANAGVSAARNKGIELARGSIIGFLDADDELLPHMVETLAGGLARFPEAGAASAPFVRVALSGQRTRVPPPGTVLPHGQKCGLVEDFFAAYRTASLVWTGSVLVWTGSVLVRRGVFEAVGVFRAGLHFGEDIELWCRIAGQYPWVFCDREVAVYYAVPGSVMSQPATPARKVALHHFLYREDEMRERIRPDLQDSYRCFRRDEVLRRCRSLVACGEVEHARRALEVIAPAPRTAEWRLMALLCRLPTPVAVVVARSALRLKEGIRWLRGRGR